MKLDNDPSREEIEARIVQLEHEKAALRETKTREGDAYCPALNMWCEAARAYVDALEAFVALVDAWESTKGATRPWCDYTGGGKRYEALKQARQRLATDHNLPLPEATT